MTNYFTGLYRLHRIDCLGFSTFQWSATVYKLFMHGDSLRSEIWHKSKIFYVTHWLPSRRYHRRRAYEYRQELMYLSMVICIYISVFAMGCFEMSAPFRLGSRRIVVAYHDDTWHTTTICRGIPRRYAGYPDTWNFGLVGRLGLGVGVKTSLVMLRGGEMGRGGSFRVCQGWG